MGSYIFGLAKFVAKERYVKDFRSGLLYANRLSCFREIENSNQGDPLEGTIWLQPDRSKLTFYQGTEQEFSVPPSDFAGPIEIRPDEISCLNAFCMYAFHPGDVPAERVLSDDLDALRKQLEVPKACIQDFGEHAVLVHNVPEFLKRVKAAAKASGCIRWYGRGLVQYHDPAEFHTPSWDKREVPFHKDNRFGYQKEYRLIFNTAPAYCNPLKLRIGDIHDITSYLPVKDINAAMEIRLADNHASS